MLAVISVILTLTSSQSMAAAAPPWQFQNVTESSLDAVLDSEYRFDALWTDFNSDGCYDAFIFGHGNAASSRLWVNQCDGSHALSIVANEVAHYYIAEPELPRGSGWLSVLDFNGDGKQDFWTRDADTMASRYVNGTAPDSQTPRFSGKQNACTDHCVFGDIDGDHVLDIVHPDRSVESMLQRNPMIPASGDEAEVIVADVDADGWPDILQPELGGYWHNQRGELQWRETGIKGDPEQFVVADFDNNGSLDLMTVGADEHADGKAQLFKNDGSGKFSDVTADSGLDVVPYAAWWTGYGNAVAADFDNDGLQDLMIAGAGYRPSVTLLRNLGGLRFAASSVDLGPAGSGSEAYKSRASVADFDNDGRLDILKTQDATNAGIWRNQTDTGNHHWLKLRVRGLHLNSDGIGTDVRVFDPDSGKLLAHMTVRAGPQHPQTWLHTGVGAHAKVDVQVRFPHGGPEYRFDAIDSDQELIVFANGCLIQHWQPGSGWPMTPPTACSSTCTSTPAAESVPRTEANRNRSAAQAERGRQAAAATGASSASPPTSTPTGC